MLIYRLEHEKSRRGPYHAGGWYSVGYIAQKDQENRGTSAESFTHSTPHEDKGLKEWSNMGIQAQGRYYCGFESMEMLEAWFPPENWDRIVFYNEKESCTDRLSLYTYEVSEYNVIRGERQCMFILPRVDRRMLFKSFHSSFEMA